MDLVLIFGFLIAIIGSIVYLKFYKLSNAKPVQLIWVYGVCLIFILMMYRLVKMKTFDLSPLFFILCVVIVAYLAALDIFYLLVGVRTKTFLTASLFKKRLFLLCWILGELVYVCALAMLIKAIGTKHIMTKFFSLPFDAILVPIATLAFLIIVFVVRCLVVDWVGLIGEFGKTFKRQKSK